MVTAAPVDLSTYRHVGTSERRDRASRLDRMGAATDGIRPDDVDDRCAGVGRAGRRGAGAADPHADVALRRDVVAIIARAVTPDGPRTILSLLGPGAPPDALTAFDDPRRFADRIAAFRPDRGTGDRRHDETSGLESGESMVENIRPARDRPYWGWLIGKPAGQR